MLRCIKADVFRTEKKVSTIITFSIAFAILIILGLVSMANIIPLEEAIPQLSGRGEVYKLLMDIGVSFFPLMIGIPAYIGIFNDDFKSHSLQYSIGHGMSRSKIVISRFLEIVIILVEAFVIVSIIVAVMGLMSDVDGKYICDALKSTWEYVPLTITMITASMVFVYLTQGGTVGMIIFILLSSGVVSTLIAMFQLIPFLSKSKLGFDLINLTIDGMYSNVYNSELDTGKRVLYGCIVVAVYVIIPIILSLRIFKRKELEF